MVLGALFRGLASALGLGGGGGSEESQWSNAGDSPGAADPARQPRSPKRPRTRGGAASLAHTRPHAQPVLQDAPAGDGGVQGLAWAGVAEREDSSGCAAAGFISCDAPGGPTASAGVGPAATAAAAAAGPPPPQQQQQQPPRRPKPGSRRAK